MGRPDANQVEIEEAARVANAHSFIIKLPELFETQVSYFMALLYNYCLKILAPECRLVSSLFFSTIFSVVIILDN